MSIVSTVGEIDQALNAIAEIKRLHAPVILPRPSGLIMTCDHCCFEDSGYQTDDCAVSHDHTVTGPACATTEIIARAGL